MLVTKDSKRRIVEGQMNDARIDVCSTWSLRDNKLSEIITVEASGDILLEGNDIEGEGEGDREGCSSVVAASRRVVSIVRVKHHRELVQRDALDDVQFALVRERSLDLQALDTRVQPCDVAWTSTVPINGDRAVLAMNEGIENSGDISEALGRVLRYEAPSERQANGRLRRERESAC